MNNVSNALGGEVGDTTAFQGIRTGANSFATVGALTNCLGVGGKRRITFTVVGRGILSTTGTETFRSGIYRIVVKH